MQVIIYLRAYKGHYILSMKKLDYAAVMQLNFLPFWVKMWIYSYKLTLYSDLLSDVGGG